MRSRSSAASGDQQTSISGSEQPLYARAYLMMGDVLTSIERRQTLLHCFDKTGLFGQRTAKDLARQIVRRTAFLGGKGGKLGFLLERELYFHGFMVETGDQNVEFTNGCRGGAGGTIDKYYVPETETRYGNQDAGRPGRSENQLWKNTLENFATASAFKLSNLGSQGLRPK